MLCAMREILRPDAVKHRNDQVARVGEAQRAVVAHRDHRVGHAVAFEAVAAGAQRHDSSTRPAPFAAAAAAPDRLPAAAGGGGLSPRR